MVDNAAWLHGKAGKRYVFYTILVRDADALSFGVAPVLTGFKC